MPTYRVKLRLEGELAWAIIEQPENAGWVGVCDSLGITVEGGTWKEFTETANEAVECIVRTHLAEGTLADFVREHGWTVKPGMPVKLIPPDEVELDIPADFLRPHDGASGADCH